jgi:ParB family chromosome partitioning protein
MSVKRGLGKGLESLLSSTTINNAKKEVSSAIEYKTPLLSGKSVVSIPVADIVPNPFQPRHIFNDDTLNELAQSIKDHGVAQPVLLRKKGDRYELIAGERRWRASKLAGLHTIPSIIKDMSDEESLEIAIIENIQREDLNIIDEAESYQLLMTKFNLTQDEVAKKVGKARSSVANTLRLLDLPAEIKLSLRNGEITAGHARAILAAGNETAQIEAWKKIKTGEMNVRTAEKLTSSKKIPVQEKQKPTELREVEHSLTSKFSTKVVLSGSAQKGKIEINYFSKEDLDRIYSLLVD